MKLKLHWQIIIGMVLGLVYGILAAFNHWGQFTSYWIAPFGHIFINLLKLIAVPLVLGSLVAGVASLSDIRKLSRIGGTTITIYLITTTISVTIGLIFVNLLQPGKSVPEEMREKLQTTYQQEVESSTANAEAVKKRGPLEPLVDMVPENKCTKLFQNIMFCNCTFLYKIITYDNCRKKFN